MIEQYKKCILLSVTGMSPAVVTETLYALVVEKGIIPTEIRVITTLQGKNKLLDSLLGIEGGRKKNIGALEEFIQDYGEKYGFNQIHFDESCITVIHDSKNNLLSDIRTPEENTFASDQIVQIVGTLCQDEQAQVHVSIAGGRKTMGFFLGYALSLYGRKQDSLSHILVSEEFENLPSFFYPKPYPYIINDRNGRELDASKGRVMLAEIPWVRLGLGLPKGLINNEVSYSDSVNKAQKILEEPRVVFLSPMNKRNVKLGSTIVSFSHRGYSLLLLLALGKKKGLRFDLHKEENEIVELFMKIYSSIKRSEDLEKFRKNLKDELSKQFSEARNNISIQVKNAFSIGEGIDTPYIPYSVKGVYKYDIDLKNINIDLIMQELQEEGIL